MRPPRSKPAPSAMAAIRTPSLRYQGIIQTGLPCARTLRVPPGLASHTQSRAWWQVFQPPWTGLRGGGPRPADRHGVLALVHEQEAAAELRGDRAERAGAREGVEAEVAGPARGLHEAADEPLGLLRRVARLLAPGGGDDRVPDDRGGALAARRLLRRHEAGRHVGLSV